MTEYFAYLDTLRETGATNMFGAGSWLRNAFPELSSEESSKVLGAWMETFDDKSSVEERVARAEGTP